MNPGAIIFLSLVAFIASGQPPSTKAPKQVSVRFENAPLSQVLDFYAATTERSLLVSPAINRAATLTLSLDGVAPAVAAKAVEKALADMNCVCIPDGQKFTRIVAKAEAKQWTENFMTPQVNPKPVPVGPKKGDGQKAAAAVAVHDFPPGVINFIRTPIAQVLDYLGELEGSKITLGPNVPAGIPISFRSQTELTVTEVKHALTVLLAMNGVALVRVDGKNLKAVPLAEVLKPGSNL